MDISAGRLCNGARGHIVKRMVMACPCCKASNDAGPLCRRCRADLSLLFAIEAERTELLEAARLLTRESCVPEALAILDRAEWLRQGDDIARRKATASLLNRDFAGALRVYDEQANATTLTIRQ
jgi:hypothetical protein